MKRRWFLAGLALPLISAGCRSADQNTRTAGANGAAEAEPLLDVPRNSKTLVMATAANYPPYEQAIEVSSAEVSTAEGPGILIANASDTAQADTQIKVVGFDIDLAQLVAERLERELIVVDLDFAALIPTLVNDEVDMVMAALEPNRSRKQRVDFSNIYYRSRHTLISLDGYLRSRDLRYQTIGIRENSVQARFADNLTNEVPDLDVVPYETLDEVFEALDIGAIEGAILEANVADTYLRRYPDFKGNIMPADQATGSAIALPKNSPLRDDINRALTDIKASGDMSRLITEWFS